MSTEDGDRGKLDQSTRKELKWPQAQFGYEATETHGPLRMTQTSAVRTFHERDLRPVDLRPSKENTDDSTQPIPEGVIMSDPASSPASAAVMENLGHIFQMEMAGVIRYMHYSFMITGHNRIPIQAWFRDQATESMQHAVIIGEKITAFGGHPPLVSAPIHETKTHSTDDILRESLSFEQETLVKYKELVKLAGDDIALEELARGFVKMETEHIEEVQKMLRRDR